MAKHVVTNVSDGPKVLNAKPVTLLQSGETTPSAVEISDSEMENALLSGWFETPKKPLVK